jgi:hypothetical protein
VKRKAVQPVRRVEKKECEERQGKKGREIDREG